LGFGSRVWILILLCVCMKFKPFFFWVELVVLVG